MKTVLIALATALCPHSWPPGIMKTFLFVTASLSTVHATGVTAEPLSLVQSASSITFAGLVFFLLAIRDPKRDKENREEREQCLKSVQEIMSEHRDERDQWRATMDKISERSRENAKDGHQSALELTQQLQRLTDSWAG